MSIDLKFLAEKWPSAIVARSEISNFTGGVLSPGRLANLDCEGSGPPRVRIGKRIAYPVEGLVSWLEKRAVLLDAGEDAQDSNPTVAPHTRKGDVS